MLVCTFRARDKIIQVNNKRGRGFLSFFLSFFFLSFSFFLFFSSFLFLLFLLSLVVSSLFRSSLSFPFPLLYLSCLSFSFFSFLFLSFLLFLLSLFRPQFKNGFLSKKISECRSAASFLAVTDQLRKRKSRLCSSA